MWFCSQRIGAYTLDGEQLLDRSADAPK